MRQRTTRIILNLHAIALGSTALAFAQSTTVIETPINNHSSWNAAQKLGSLKNKLFVVTVDKPDRRQICRVQSFTEDTLVCSRAIGGPRTYLPQQVAALILPGNDGLMRLMVLGFIGGSGAAIWATVVLAATCPACAAVTGGAAYSIWYIPTTIICRHYKSDRLLYLAPGQQLSRKFGYVER